MTELFSRQCDHCGIILHRTEPLFCNECLSKARHHFKRIQRMYDVLPLMLGQLAPISMDSTPRGSDGRPTPGGNILVMLSNGSPGFSDDEDTVKDSDPLSVSFELWYWAKEFAAKKNEALLLTESDNSIFDAAITYLERNMFWAWNYHPGYSSFLVTLITLDTMMTNALGFTRQPTRLGGQCTDCQGHLIRPVNQTTGLELEDMIVCEDCKLEVNPTTYQASVKKRLLESINRLEGTT